MLCMDCESEIKIYYYYYYTRDFNSFQYPLFTTKNHHFFNLEIAYLLLASPLLLLIRHLFVWNLGLLFDCH